MTKPRALLYLRLSRSSEVSTSLAGQEADLRQLAAREGWEVAEVFRDDGLSGGYARANADEALRRIRDREADVLAVWRLDRWSRQGLGAVADLVDVLDAREAAGDPALFVTLRDGLRSDQSAWRIIATVLAEVARQEREATSARVTASVERLRAAGRFPGGTVPYGYRSAPHPDGVGRILEPDPDEAEIVRGLAERILGGSSIFSLVVELNANGIRPHRARSWTMDTLSTVLSGDAIVGRVRVGGQLLRDDDGLPRVVWEPVLDLETWHAVRAVLAARGAARPYTRRAHGARLLSGLASCGECGRPLYVRRPGARRRSDGALIPAPVVYACSARGNGQPCPGSTVSAERLEEHVSDVFLRTVGRFEVVRPVIREAPAVDLVEAEQALADVVSRLGDVTLSPAELASILERRAALADRVAALRAAGDAPAEVDFVPTGETYAEEWDRLDAEGRREALLSALVTVAVTKGRRGRKGLDPARVAIEWRSE